MSLYLSARNISGLNTTLAILELLAENGEYEQYEIHKILQNSYRTSLRHIANLERLNLIHTIRKEASEKGGMAKKILGLTRLGLVELLIHRCSYDFIEKLAAPCQALLPLILGKWGFFKDHDVDRAVAARLCSSARRVIGFSLIETTPVTSVKPEAANKKLLDFLVKECGKDRKQMADMFDEDDRALKHILEIDEERVNELVLAEYWVNPERFKDFLLVALKDEELRSWFKTYFVDLREYYLRNIASWMSLLEAS